MDSFSARLCYACRKNKADFVNKFFCNACYRDQQLPFRQSKKYLDFSFTELDDILNDIDPIIYPKIFFAFVYNKFSKRLVKDFKYRKPYYRKFWSKELFNYLLGHLSWMLSDVPFETDIKTKVQKKIDLYFAAVPMHYQRLQNRTYNQAELVAHDLSKQVQQFLMSKNLFCYYQCSEAFTLHKINQAIYLKDLFIRIKATENLYSKAKYERLEILRDAFALNPKFDLSQIKEKNENVLIILDDICTTGATFLELFKETHKAKLKFDEIIFLALTGRNIS